MRVNRAKVLRKNSTPAERAMWRLLFPFRTGGFHFRKQVPIGPYFADIACHHAKMVIEVDGDTHGAAAALRHDAARNAFLAAEGYTVLRFSNRDVLGNPEGVYSVISAALDGRPRTIRTRGGNPLPSPPHKGEGVPTARAEDGLTPLPTSPTRGEVKGRRAGQGSAAATEHTLPLVGRVGEGGHAKRDGGGADV